MGGIAKTGWLCGAAFILSGALALSGCQSTPRPEDDPAWQHCAENARTVGVAKRTYRLGHNVPLGTAVTWEDLSSCLPAQWAPFCQSGGEISPGRIGGGMECSVHGVMAP